MTTMRPTNHPCRGPRTAASTPVTPSSRCRARTQVRPMITPLKSPKNSFGPGSKWSCSQGPSSPQVTGYDFSQPSSRPPRPGSIAAACIRSYIACGRGVFPASPAGLHCGNTGPERGPHHDDVFPASPAGLHCGGVLLPDTELVDDGVFPAPPAGLHCGTRTHVVASAIRAGSSWLPRPGSVAVGPAGSLPGAGECVFPGLPGRVRWWAGLSEECELFGCGGEEAEESSSGVAQEQGPESGAVGALAVEESAVWEPVAAARAGPGADCGCVAVVSHGGLPVVVSSAGGPVLASCRREPGTALREAPRQHPSRAGNRPCAGA
ncbi:MAG: hypothetical protein QG608_3115, partial [Actinomycetota bacterium]|nr:hypothetical protein [Actinomycetota bacterium]